MKKNLIGRFHSVKAARNAGHRPQDYRAAGIHETMGPHFKPLLWVGNKPYVKKDPEAVAVAE